MPRNLTRRRLLAGSAATALAALAGCSATTPFVGKRVASTETVELRGAAQLGVESENGDVVLDGTDRETLRVETVKKSSSIRTDLENLTLETTRRDGSLRFEADWDGEPGILTSRPTMDIDIQLPAALSVAEVTTGVGDIDIADVSGDTEATSAVGDVRLRRVDGTVTARSETGDVDVEQPSALRRASSDTGDVSVDIPSLDAGDVRVDTDTGDIRARIAAGLNADLVARTDTGEVLLDGIPLSDVASSGEPVTESVRGVLGDGGPTLRIETSTGDITLREL